MKKIMTLKMVLLLLAVAFLATGCSDDDPSGSLQPNIVEAAIAAGDFNTLVTAVDAADLVGALSEPGPFTVFAPTDAAFAALPAGTVDTLLEPANIGTLQDILLYHVVSGEYDASQVVALDSLDTLYGLDITIDVNGNVVLNAGTANPATILATDIQTSNGIIHVIDAVLIP